MSRLHRMLGGVALVMLTATGAAAQIGIVEPVAPPRPAAKPRAPRPARAPEAKPKIELPRSPSAAEPKAPLPITVETRLDRTAAWVGDPIAYTIEITCPPGTDILAADISRDRLKLNGLDVASAVQQRETSGDGTIVYRAKFRLVSFVTDGSAVGVESQSVRYYVHTAGQPPETLVPADEVQLPARRIAIRSVLPEGDVEWIRDARVHAGALAAVKYLVPVGLAAVALALVPLVAGIGVAVRRWQPRRSGPSRRRNLQLQRAALEQIRALDLSQNGQSRRDVLDRLNTLIRERLADFDIPGPNLTADEIGESIAARGTRIPGDDVVRILRDCERAVYGRDDDLPGPDAVRAALDEAERLLAPRASWAR